jgi:sec-independent protein translocase protein TatA
MFGTGHLWLVALIVLVIVLIIWGPGKLGDIGGAMGRGLREFRKASAIKPDASPEEPKTDETKVSK